MSNLIYENYVYKGLNYFLQVDLVLTLALSKYIINRQIYGKKEEKNIRKA